MNNYNKNFQVNIAIDLGFGTGNYTEFLISKGFKVTVVDNFLGKEDDWEGFRTTVEKGELLEYFKDFKCQKILLYY